MNESHPDLEAVKAASETFERWATMRTNWELAEELATDPAKSFPPESVIQMNDLFLLFREQAKPLSSIAKIYDIDAEPLRTICRSTKGGENEARRAAVRAVLSDLEGAVVRYLRKRSHPLPSGDGHAFQQNANACSHGNDFTWVKWFGSDYTFTKGNQAATVKALWEDWERGGQGLGNEAIADQIGAADGFRVDTTFRVKGGRAGRHPAWRTMICCRSKGVYSLQVPS